MEAPVKVACQTLANGDMMIHNYNNELVTAKIQLPDGKYMDHLTGMEIVRRGNNALLKMPSRSRIWLKKMTETAEAN